MSKTTKKLMLFAGLALALPLAGCNKVDLSKIIDDPIQYEDPLVVDYANPYRVDDDQTFNAAKKVTIHYHNDDMACLNRRFYTWVTGVDGVERKPDAATWTATDMSITLDYENDLPEYLDLPSIFFIVKVAGTWAGQSEDIELQYSEFNPDENGNLEVWTIPGEGSSIEIYRTEAETKFPKVKTAKFTDWKTIHCEADEKPLYYNLYAFDKNYLKGTTDEQVANKQFHLFKNGNPTSNIFDIKFNYTAKINVQYVIETEYASNPGRIQRIVVSAENLYETERFHQFYEYDGDDLGMTYTPEGVTFKVWSPISAFVAVNIFNTGTPKALGGSDAKRSYEMSYVKGGVWQVTIKSDEINLKGKYYTYSLAHSSGNVESIDPYAKACGINGARGFIYDNKSSEANPTGWDSVPQVWNNNGEYDISNPQDLSVYEVHIRDLTMDDTWVSNQGNQRGTYGAFIEKGTTYTASGKTVTTGFDHITELGVKAVQLLPVFDNDNDERPEKMKFNWGYNPLNYNCVDGGYSSDPYAPLVRINEYKNLVKAFSENGNHTRVVMDVVYNHVSSASSSCFTKVMPKYYFRYTENWEYYDGSGCSNEVKSDAPMMRKFIIDSLCWWASEYKIKGFRFDLMGLIDSWTLREAKSALFKIDPDIYIYGEGWTSGGYHGKYELDGEGNLINGGSETALVYSQLWSDPSKEIYLGGFNDCGRNALKGSNDDGYNQNPYPQWGFVSQGAGDVGGKSSLVADMMKGINSNAGANPQQTINYVSCHDNYTLWDQLNYTLANSHNATNHTPVGKPATEDVVRASIASHAAVMASNGVGFMQGGEELYRTKSYTSEELATLMAAGTVRPYPDYVHYSTDPDVLIATSDVRMYDGTVVTHNSYKSSDSVNSFKWDRKISVDGTDTYQYINTWKALVKAHNDTNKYSFPENCDTPKLNTWNVFDGSTVFAMWNGNEAGTKGYYFIFAGRAGGTIGINTDDLTTGNFVFASRTDYTKGSGEITLKPFTFLCYRKGY